MGQRFQVVVQKAWDQKSFQKPCNDCLREVSATTIQDFQSTGAPCTTQAGFGFGAMVAAPISDRPELAEFSLLDFQPERKTVNMHFVSMGSGQILADPFLAFISRVLWCGKQPDVRTAMFGVYWALDHAIKYAPGGVGEPIAIAILHRQKGQWIARSLEERELQEQAQHITEIENRISKYPVEIIDEATTTLPPTPPRIG